MKPKIRIHPRGGQETQPSVDAAYELKDELEGAGIEFEHYITKALEPISTLAITIIGAVAAHYV
ncbi:MAG: hypothetical protein ACK4Z6_02220 [Candidatus Methylomirabilales bacterium]